MQLRISKKNSKIGAIPNISLTPGASCVKDIPCLNDGCYAMKSYKQYPNVKNAWDKNLELYKKDPDTFFKNLDAYLYGTLPERFRLFVGGDFPDEEFYYRMCDICEEFPGTSFLVFTKRYDYDYAIKPDNLQVVLSIWPGVDLPTNRKLPWAWLEEDLRRPEGNYFACLGGCEDCGHFCWNKLTYDVPVIFPRH